MPPSHAAQFGICGRCLSAEVAGREVEIAASNWISTDSQPRLPTTRRRTFFTVVRTSSWLVMDLLERDLTRTLKEENRTGNQNTAPAEPDLNFWSKPRVENTRKLVFDLGRDAARLARKFVRSSFSLRPLPSGGEPGLVREPTRLNEPSNAMERSQD